MSFGVGLADIFETLHFVKVTYDAWKEAPERYRTIEYRLRSLRSLLERIVTHSENSQRRRSKSSQRDLSNTLAAVDDTVDQLSQIIEKRSSLKFWDRLRLNSHQINDLSAALDRNIQDLTCICGVLSLEHNRELRHGQHALRRGQDELLYLVGQLLPAQVPAVTPKAVAGPVNSLGMSPFFVTNHDGHDDPSIWRNSKQRAIDKGLTSREMEFGDFPLHDALQTMATAKHQGRRRTRSSSPQRSNQSALPEQYHSRSRPRSDKASLPWHSHALDDGVAPHIPDRSRLFPDRLILTTGWHKQFSAMPFGDDYTTANTSRERSRCRHRRRSRYRESEIEIEYFSEAVFMHR